jgi:hypothetical protein
LIENDSESSKRQYKRPQKTRQLPQFEVYPDEILEVNSPEFPAQNEFTPVLIECESSEIWSHFIKTVLLSLDFRHNYAEFHPNSTPKTSIQSS